MKLQAVSYPRAKHGDARPRTRQAINTTRITHVATPDRTTSLLRPPSHAARTRRTKITCRSRSGVAATVRSDREPGREVHVKFQRSRTFVVLPPPLPLSPPPAPLVLPCPRNLLTVASSPCPNPSLPLIYSLSPLPLPPANPYPSNPLSIPLPPSLYPSP